MWDNKDMDTMDNKVDKVQVNKVLAYNSFGLDCLHNCHINYLHRCIHLYKDRRQQSRFLFVVFVAHSLFASLREQICFPCSLLHLIHIFDVLYNA